MFKKSESLQKVNSVLDYLAWHLERNCCGIIFYIRDIAELSSALQLQVDVTWIFQNMGEKRKVLKLKKNSMDLSTYFPFLKFQHWENL